MNSIIHTISLAILLAGCTFSDSTTNAVSEENKAVVGNHDDNIKDQQSNTRVVKIGDISYELRCREILDSNGSQVNSDSTDEKATIFDFKIKSDSLTDDPLKMLASTPQEFEALLKYCAFGIQKDVCLVNNIGDSIPCDFAHFERTYGLLPGVNFQFVFELEEKDQGPLTFVINDKLFGNGPVKIKI